MPRTNYSPRIDTRRVRPTTTPGTILTTAPDRLGGTDTSMVQTVQDGRVWVFAQATGYCCFFDREGLSVCSPDSAPCLPAAPGAPAAVLCSGLDTCFCVAALGATLVPAAGPEVSPCVGPAAMAIGAQSNNVDRIPADKRALTAIALIRCLPLSGPNTPPSRARFVLIGYLIRKLRRYSSGRCVLRRE